MPAYVPFVLGGIVAAALVVWSVARQRRRDREQKQSLQRLGFYACPEKKKWLEETITRIENNRGYRYEVRDPKRLPGDSAVYYYHKLRHQQPDEDAEGEEEILFPLKRRSPAGLVLTIKPTALAPGRATRLLGALAAGPWDSQPDDLQRIDVPRELANTNLVAALGPPGARLYDLVDERVVSAIQGLGDAGGMFVQFRDDWCLVSSGSVQTPFRIDRVLSAIRTLG
jgi:hypothetical protein